MRTIVISNDVVPGFGVPVAAPGLRAAGLAEGLRAHGHDVHVAVPADLMSQLFGDHVPAAPPHTDVVAPASLNDFISEFRADVVVFINANLTPHLDPNANVHYVYDLFAPKLLELQASGLATSVDVENLTAMKVRALAMADSVWVNGSRKRPYATEWLNRPDVATARARLSRAERPRDHMAIVEMPVPLPAGVTPKQSSPLKSDTTPIRVGIAGYAQRWSALDTVHFGHELLVSRGIELHVLLPGHWGGGTEPPRNALPYGAITHDGPLEFSTFSTWVQSMDAMVDVFAPSPERSLAMITRSAVALRLGVPLIHAVDSEVTDIVNELNAGWILAPDDLDGWRRVCDELVQPDLLAEKGRGAVRSSLERFAPREAVRTAATRLKTSLEVS